MLHGHLQLVHTVVSQCSTTVATIRAQFQSTLELYNTTFQENEEMIATIAVTHESKMQMNFSKLEQNVAVLAPVVVVEGSQAFVADSCWTVSNNSRPAILVDSTSSLVPEKTTVSILEPEESTTESPTACGAGIWKLDSSWTCLETQSCNGACQTMTIQDQCQMPSKIPAWGKSVATSSANRMLGGTLLSMVIAGILILV